MNRIILVLFGIGISLISTAYGNVKAGTAQGGKDYSHQSDNKGYIRDLSPAEITGRFTKWNSQESLKSSRLPSLISTNH